MSNSEYVEFFQDMRAEIRGLGDGQLIEQFKKTLYLNLLDCISGVMFDTKQGSGANNFSKLVENYSQWSDSKRYSLTYLKRLMEINSNPYLDPLRIEIDRAFRYHERLIDSNRFGHWMYQGPEGGNLGVFSLKNDLHESSLEGVFRQVRRRETKDFKPYEYKHSYLLYSCRSMLVHRFKEAGMRIRPEIGNVPYYEYYIARDREDSTISDVKFELCYPNEFLDWLCSDVIIGTDSYFEDHNIDAMNRFFQIGFYLHSDLNQEITFFDKLINQRPYRS